MSLQDGQYMWFYGASPAEQQAFLAQGQMPPDYPVGGAITPSGAPSGALPPPVAAAPSDPLITFGDGGNLSDYEQFIANGGYPVGPETRPGSGQYPAGAELQYDPAGKNAPGGRYNPNQPTLADSDPESFAYQQKHGPTSQNPDVWNPSTVLGQRAIANDYNGLDPAKANLARGTRSVQDANAAELARLQALADQSQVRNQAAVDDMGRLIDAQSPLNQAYVDRSAFLAGALGGHRDVANQMSLDALGAYSNDLRQISARNDALIDGMGGVYQNMSTPLQSQTFWDGDLTSQAAIADPQALAAQNEALGFFSGGMNGALDYQSAAAQAYADPRYVAMRDQGLEDLYAVSQGSKDVQVGEADPKAYADAMAALDQASVLSNPAVTDQENFLYEQARQRWESEMRGVQQAKMSNLRRRGMSGGGAELTSTALSNADISQKRVLADLAASSGAVQRAGDMLKLKGALATNLNEAGNTLATGNANRQLQALGLYQQGAETAQQSSFDQEYKRGVAADNASANNQQTRLQSGIAYGNQANAMQDDAFNRGQAQDTMDRFNREGQLTVSMHRDQFDQHERDALWGRTTDYVGAGLNANAQNSNNATNIFQGATSVANNNYVRDRDVIQGWDLASQRQWQGEQTELGQRLGVQGTQIGINNTNTGVQSGVIGSNIANNQWNHGVMMQNSATAMGDEASKRAALETALATIDAKEQAGKSGLFGTFIGSSDRGLFSGFGIGAPDYEAQRQEAKRRYGFT